jgi:hypothetical protein
MTKRVFQDSARRKEAWRRRTGPRPPCAWRTRPAPESPTRRRVRTPTELATPRSGSWRAPGRSLRTARGALHLCTRTVLSLRRARGISREVTASQSQRSSRASARQVERKSPSSSPVVPTLRRHTRDRRLPPNDDDDGPPLGCCCTGWKPHEAR